MAQTKTVVNARDLRLGWGLNGVPVSANGAAMMNYGNFRWVRNDIQFTGGDGSTGTPNSGSTNGFVGLAAYMRSSGMFDPNLRGQCLLDGYYQDRTGFTWSAQQTFLNTALTLTNQDGSKIFRAIEGANEIGDDIQGGGSIYPNGTDRIAYGNANNPVRDSTSRDCFVQWANALANYKSSHSNLFTGVEVVAPTILDGVGFASSSSTGLPGDYPANTPDGINISGKVDYACTHWYSTSQSGGTGTPCSPDTNVGGQNNLRYDNNYNGFEHGESGGSNNLPMIVSEFGQTKSVGDSGNHTGQIWNQDGVSCAWCNMAGLLDHFALGGKRVIYYTATGNPASDDDGSLAHSGFNWFWGGSANNPTPSVTGLRNMTTLMSLNNNYADNSNLSDTGSFSPRYSGSGFSISGLTKASMAGTYLICPKSDGSTMIWLWREPVYDPGNGQATTALPSANTITVNFGSAQTGKVWDPTGTTTYGSTVNFTNAPKQVSTFTSQSSISVTLYGAPLAIELQGVTVTSAPAQPTGLSVTSTTSTRATVTWTLASAGQTNSPSGYKMQYQKGSTTGTWLTLTTVDTSSNSFTYYGLDVSSQYYFRIIATNSIGDSTASASVNTTTSGTGTTTTPAVAGSNYQIVREDASNVASRNLSLPSVPSNGNKVLVIWGGYGANGGNSSSISAPSGATQLIGATYDGTEENMQAWLFTANGSSNSFGPFSNFLSSDHAGWIICEVSNWSSVDISHGNVSTGTTTAVGWTVPTPASSNNVILSALYETYAATIGAASSGSSVLVAAPSSVAYHQNVLLKTVAGSLSLALSGGTANTTSMYMNFIVYGSGAPSQVTGVTTSNTTDKQTTVSWTSKGSGAASYKLEVSTDGGTTKTTVSQTIPSSQASYTVTGLTASTSYSFYVSAANDSGYSTASTAATATTSATPTIQYVQSAVGTNQTGSGSVTVTLTNAPTVGNYLVFYVICQTATTSVSGIPTTTVYNSALSAGSNGDQKQAAYIVTASDSTKSWTLSGFVNEASVAVVEMKGVSTIDTPTIVSQMPFTQQAHFDPVVVAPSDNTKAVGIYFMGLHSGPDSWGTMPSGITMVQQGSLSTYASNATIAYHTAAVLQLNQSVSAGTKQIPFTLGINQGADPMLFGFQFIGASQAPNPPGTTSLTFGSTTSSSIALSWSAASGTVDHYIIAWSTSSSMTNPQTTSVNGLSTTITNLQSATDYWFTITAYNGTTSGTTSSAQKATTATSNAASQPVLIGGLPFVMDSSGLPILKK